MTCEHKLTAAEKALTDAQSQAAGYEQEVGKIKGQLKGLPNESKTARSRVSDLKNTVRAMAKSGQINDALYAMQELNRAIDELKKLTDPKQEEELFKNCSPLSRKQLRERLMWPKRPLHTSNSAVTWRR